MRERRGLERVEDLCNGPGKLTQALAIAGADNGTDLCAPDAGIYLLDAPEIPDSSVTTTPRVGLNHVKEPWKSIDWRFLLKN
jgi:DNA-3-methyladenine glycosylase